MKVVSISLVLALMLANACSPDEQVPQKATSMEAMIGQERWSSDQVFAVRDGSSLFITMLKSADTFTRIDMFINDATVKTHHLSGLTETNFPDSYVSLIPEVYAVSNPAYRSMDYGDFAGEVTITEFDTINGVVSGTFFSRVKRSFPGSETIEISEGSFADVSIEKDKFVRPFGYSGRATAKADNFEFLATSTGGEIVPMGPYAGKLMLTAYSPKKDAIPASRDIRIFLPPTIEPGYYLLGSLSSPCSIRFWDVDEYESTSGYLVVTHHDTINGRIVGKFEFVGQPLIGGQPAIPFLSGEFIMFYHP